MKTLLLSLCILTTAVADAQILSVASGDWDTTATWSGGIIPGITDSVVINGHTVNLNVTTEVGDLTVPSGAITGSGSLTVNNIFSWTGGVITGSGSIVVEGPSIFAGSSRQLTGYALQLEGGCLWTSGTMGISNNGMLINAMGSTFTIDHNSAMALNNSGVGTGFFQNDGTLIKTGSGTLSMNFALSFSSSGMLTISNGKILCSTSIGGSYSGSMQIATGASLDISAATHTFSGLTSEGDGYIHVLNFGVLSAGPTLCTLSKLQQSAGSITGSGDIDVTTEFLWQGGMLSGVGTMTVEGSLSMSGTSGRVINGKTLINEGSAMWLSGSLDLRSEGTLYNAPGAEFMANPSGALSVSNGGTGTGHFQNAGTFVKDGTGTLTFNAAVNFNQEGSMSILNNKITFANAGGSTFTGMVNIALDASLEFFSSTHILDGLIASGAGQVHVSNSAICNSGPTVTSINNLRQSGGTISGGGEINVISEFLWEGGQLSGAGLMTVEGAAIFSSGSKTISVKTLVLEGGTSWTAGSIAMNNASVIRNPAGATFVINNPSSLSVTNSSATSSTFENLGLCIKSGAGALSFSNLINVINTGELRGIGTISVSAGFNNTGTLAPGLSPGLLTMNGLQPLSAMSTLEIEMLDGGSPGIGHDQLLRAGNLTLAGTLTVSEIGTVPDGIYTIIQLTTGTISGSFGATNLPPGYAIQVNPTTVLLAKNTPFPLTLISFIAKKTDKNTVDLQWITTDEQNVSHFEIQRSDDSNVFATIGTIQALNNSKGGEYDLIDASPKASVNYYRLRIVDLDGSSAFSPIRAVRFVREGNILVHPTLTSDDVMIETDEPIFVRLFSSSGILTHQLQIDGQGVLDMTSLPAGMYVLHVSQKQPAIRIVKQ